MPAVAVAPNLVAPIAASSSSRVRVRIPPAASTQRGDVNRSCEDQFSSDLAIPRTNELIDLQRPFAVIAASILHHLNDDEAYDVAARIRAQLRPGCYVLISNFLDDDEPRAEELERAFLEGGLGTGRFRTWSEQRRFFEGLDWWSRGWSTPTTGSQIT
jgi:hypothetical protein